MWSTTRNAQKNPKEVTEIMNSMKKGYALVKDSKVSANVSNDHKINRRYDEPREDVCPNKRVLNGVCPSRTTYKDQEIDRVMRKPAKDLMNSRMGVCPNVR